jgi:hypothetical protein
MRRNQLTRLAAALAAAAIVPVAACNESSDGPTTPPPSDDASLRVINKAAGAVNVTVDGQVVAANVAAGSVSDRIGLAAGNHQVQIRLAAGGSPQSVSLLARLGRDYLVDAEGDGQGVVAQVDTGAIPDPGKTKIRLIHMAKNAPAILPWRTQPDFPTPVTIQDRFEFGDKTPFIQSDPGTWELWVTRVGETEPKLATSGPVTLEANWIRTLFLIDKADGSGVEIVDERDMQ